MELDDLPNLSQVRALAPFSLWVEFDDGSAGAVDVAAVDLRDYEGLLEQLAAPGVWESVRRDQYDLIRWSDGNCLDPLLLYGPLHGRTVAEQDAIWDADLPPAEPTPVLLAVEGLSGRRLRLEYDDGVVGIVQLTKDGGWKDEAEFAAAQVAEGGDAVEWPNGWDACGWFLYEQLTGRDLHGFGPPDAIAAAD